MTPTDVPETVPTATARPASLLARVGRVFSFDTSVYAEVAASDATLQAVVVVSVAALLSGSFFTLALFFAVVPLALIGVGVSALLVQVAARLFGGHPASLGEWYRALAFAQAPLVIGVVPFVGSFIAFVYWLAAGVAAISSVARMSVGIAILTFFLAGLLPFLVLAGGAGVIADLAAQ